MMTTRLDTARKLAAEIIAKIQTQDCKVELIGSVARGKKNPKDIDIRIYVRGKEGKRAVSEFIIDHFPNVRQSEDAFFDEWYQRENPAWFPVADCIEGIINTDIFWKVA